MRSELVGTAALGAALTAALLLTWLRAPAATDEARRRTTLVFVVTLLLQTLHFAEEYWTGFYRLFPPVVGLPPWSLTFFVTFNLFWLAVWACAAFGLRAGSGIALLPVWFLAIASTINGVAHPMLALRAGGYFPGVVTAPLVGVAGAWLFARLVAITRPRPDATWRDVLLFFETIAFTMFVPGSIAYWLPRYALDLWAPPGRWSSPQVIALAPLAAGLVAYLRCVWDFAARGRGIPLPIDHPTELVVSGLYRYVRNPMYVGVLVFLLGETLFLESWEFLLYVLVWFALVNLFVLVYEEPNLRRRFGASYEQYTREVGRWIPGRRSRERFVDRGARL